jgi:hypothetical protein
MRVGKILEVASSKRSTYPAAAGATGKTPRRYARSSTPNAGRGDPTQLRLSRSAASGTHASALSISEKPFAKGWRGRLGGLAVLFVLTAAVVALSAVAVHRRNPARQPVIPIAASLPPPTAVMEAPAPTIEPVRFPAPTATETAAPVEPPPPTTAKPPTPKTAKPGVARPKAAPPSTPPTASAARAVQDESDMLNRRR